MMQIASGMFLVLICLNDLISAITQNMSQDYTGACAQLCMSLKGSSHSPPRAAVQSQECVIEVNTSVPEETPAANHTTLTYATR